MYLAYILKYKVFQPLFFCLILSSQMFNIICKLQVFNRSEINMHFGSYK